MDVGGREWSGRDWNGVTLSRDSDEVGADRHGMDVYGTITTARLPEEYNGM